jgi:hypothetical protein
VTADCLADPEVTAPIPGSRAPVGPVVVWRDHGKPNDEAGHQERWAPPADYHPVNTPTLLLGSAYLVLLVALALLAANGRQTRRDGALSTFKRRFQCLTGLAVVALSIVGLFLCVAAAVSPANV